MSKNWVNLHNHTTFSMLDGHGPIERYVKRVNELQMGSIAITDHGNIHGWLEFYRECKDHDVRPILGLEAYQARKTRHDRDPEERAGAAANEWQQRGPYHLSILAKNNVGYHNLIKLSSLSFLDGFYVKPRIDYELLDKYHDGLIILSGCLNGEVQQALLREDYDFALKAAATMQEIVGHENYFIEVQDHGIEEQHRVKEGVLSIAKAINAPVVATGDCHYVYKEDAFHHDVMLCAGTGSRLDEEERFKFSGPEFYVKSYEEMLGIFEPDWLANTVHVAEMVDIDLDFGELHFPHYPDIPEEHTVDSFLEEEAWKGAKARYGDPLPSEVMERMEYELRVVKKMGFQEYFLVVSDLVRWAKDNGVRTGYGRGSAAGSILSYVLNITNLDPIEFGLIFERFLVEGRKSMPDIDLDFNDRYREKVINYARDKYGDDRVAHICTMSSVRAKTAIRDAARVLGYEYSTGDQLAKMVPPPVLGVEKTLTEALQMSQELVTAYKNDPDTTKIIDAALGIEGIYRQTGIHAAGVVIGQRQLTDFVPVMQNGEDKPIVTQWNMEDVELCGQLKIDFLGLRNLGVIDMCIDNVLKSSGITIDTEDIPLDDAATYKMLCEGNTIGVFQLESSGMQEMSMDMQPTNINDIMALISLYRPGPLGSGMHMMYINRKHGREKVQYLHPMLKDTLKDSYGILLYQEDVLNTVRVLAGFSAAEADDLRKAIGKKQMDKIHIFREKFVEGCAKTAEVSTAIANKIYSDIEYFAGYGFNRAHAASYAMVSYLTAYLKCHYPAEYMAALLSSVTKKPDKLAVYLYESKRMGLEVQAPDINKSDVDFSVNDDGTILFGLSSIDGVGEAQTEPILKNEEPYVSLEDFFRRSDHAVLNKKLFENLVYSGSLDNILTEDRFSYMNRRAKLEMLTLEKKRLKTFVTDHPLVDFWDVIAGRVDHLVIDLDEGHDGQFLSLGGIISGVEYKTTKAGKKMAKVDFEDTTSKIDVVIFPGVLEKMADVIEPGAIGVLSGKVVNESDEGLSLKMFGHKFEPIDKALLHGSKPLVIRYSDKVSLQSWNRICDILDNTVGDSPVYFQYITDDGWKVTLDYGKQSSIEIEDAVQKLITISELEEKV